MRMLRIWGVVAAIALLIGSLGGVALADKPPRPPGSDEHMQTEIDALRVELDALRVEFDALQTELLAGVTRGIDPISGVDTLVFPVGLHAEGTVSAIAMTTNTIDELTPDNGVVIEGVILENVEGPEGDRPWVRAAGGFIGSNVNAANGNIDIIETFLISCNAGGTTCLPGP